MSVFKDRGITLKSADNKDYDKTLTVLLENRGKAYLYARGAKKPGSKLAAVSEPFSFAEFVVYEGPGFLSLTQAELLDGFYGLRSDYDVYVYSCFLLEACDKIMQPRMDARAVVGHMAEALRNLCGKGPNSFFIFLVYLLKLLKLEGYMPELNNCSVCSRESGKYVFSGSGLVCGACVESRARYAAIDAETAAGLRYIYSTDEAKLLRMNAEEALLKKMLAVALFFIEENLDLRLKSGKLFF